MSPMTEPELTEIVEHALSRRWGPNQSAMDYSQPYNLIAYCSERVSQIPFQLNMPGLPAANKERILTNLSFFNGVMGRVAQLEGRTMESSSYSSFQIEAEQNQVDVFLERLGYRTKI